MPRYLRSTLAALALSFAFASQPAFATEAGGAEHGAAGAHHGSQAPDINWVSFDYKEKVANGENTGPPFLFALLNFAVLLFLIRKFAGPKLKSYLRDRSDEIRDALEEGKRLRAEAERKLAEYQAKIAGVDAEVTALVKEIREQAEAEKARILAEAEAQSAALKKAAEERIAAEIARARYALEQEVVNAAVQAAETLLREHTRDDDQQRLVKDFVAAVDQSAQPGAPS